MFVEGVVLAKVVVFYVCKYLYLSKYKKYTKICIKILAKVAVSWQPGICRMRGVGLGMQVWCFYILAHKYNKYVWARFFRKIESKKRHSKQKKKTLYDLFFDSIF